MLCWFRATMIKEELNVIGVYTKRLRVKKVFQNRKGTKTERRYTDFATEVA